MNNNCDDQEIFHIFNLIGRHTELKPILDVISQWLESRIPDALVTIMLYKDDTQTLNVISGKQHFSKEYCNAIQDLNLTIEKGEFAFLVGQSGSGKSTLIKLILKD